VCSAPTLHPQINVRAMPAGRPMESLARYQEIRDHTEYIAASLTAEDQCVQSMPDASPAKWHRAHTTWFFEEFVLKPFFPGYGVFDTQFRFLFNSYYEAVGPRHPRFMRGLLTRPSAEQISRYRSHVDAAMRTLLGSPPGAAADRVELGLQHEQQHQELMLTDMLHAFSQNPLSPPVLPGWHEPQGTKPPTQFIANAGGVVAIGHEDPGFCFDNEEPAHTVVLQPYEIASRLVRNREWLAFIMDGGYRTSTLWMSDGWARAQAEAWSAPLYWRNLEGEWHQMGPNGVTILDPDAPVRHVSWYEADAYARWANARLPTEEEWEAASRQATEIQELIGHAWQWTGSAYRPYPGYHTAAGAIGEYNGKFMIGQMVLRGGSLATPAGHARPSYRNFFHPEKRWQFSGVRLARDI
jgi:ergothioneine biosynthesis protein EgtB